MCRWMVETPGYVQRRTSIISCSKFITRKKKQLRFQCGSILTGACRYLYPSVQYARLCKGKKGGELA